ncbi:unnamed protein product [Echinostoma caproni]|uniref:Uncharacterized protein n=1 Tax=Echinostoma caproni TaxID=27848 RepID=A0A3P8LB66_9TREM|nr:unnamed protein product [Echinostoma caproni]
MEEKTISDDESAIQSTTEIVIRRRSTTMTEQEHNYPIVLLAGGLIAFAGFCCYIISRLLFCRYQPCEWHGAFLNTLEELLGLAETRGSCPLRRERLSAFMDYTPGSMPF